MNMRSGKYDSGDADTKEMVAQLAQLAAEYTTLAERARKLKEYEELFAVNATNFSDVDVVRPPPAPSCSHVTQVTEKLWTGLACIASM